MYALKAEHGTRNRLAASCDVRWTLSPGPNTEGRRKTKLNTSSPAAANTPIIIHHHTALLVSRRPKETLQQRAAAAEEAAAECESVRAKAE